VNRRPQRLPASLRLCAIFVAAAVVAAHGKSNALEKEPYGYFRPAGRMPKPFADVAELHLSGAGEYGAQATPPYLASWKQKGRGEGIPAARADNLWMRNPLQHGGDCGISYSFEGTFARLDFHGGGVPIGEVMLSGRLTKLRDGKQVASAQIGFAFEAGG
jgi:hypothetical protein